MIPFSIWVIWGEGRTTPPPMDYGSGKSPMDERVKIKFISFIDDINPIINIECLFVIEIPREKFLNISELSITVCLELYITVYL